MNINYQEFQRRRQALSENMLDNSVAIFRAASDVQRSRDTDFAFRQHSDFAYLTGFPEADAVLVIGKIDGTHHEHLFCLSKDKMMEIWHGRRVGPDAAAEQYGLEAASSLENLQHDLIDLLNGRRAIYYALGESKELSSLVEQCMDKLRAAPKRGFKAPVQLIDVREMLHEMRLFKSEEEIRVMRKSAQISCDAHLRAMRFAAAGKTEYQLEAELHHEFAMQGARHPAYGTIVGSGDNACILHYTNNSEVLSDGDLVLIDAGSEYQGYAADITRTFPVNGRFNAPQRALYDLVLATQQQCIELVKPGHTLKQVGDAAIEKLTQGLVELGLLSGEVETLIKDEAYRAFYMHGIGHWLGLDVHDVGEYKCDNKDRPFAPGMVLTIEPGLYIDTDADVEDKWKGIGIRIEDNILVTADGHENLTASLIKHADDIEAYMCGNDD